MQQRLPVRFIRVTDVQRITPRMARVTFGGDDLADFVTQAPDQQVKLYFPKPGQSVPLLPLPEADDDFTSWYQSCAAVPEAEQPWMRSYTVRAHHPHAATIDIDFVLHDDAGPATQWARSAAPGDTLAMFGPSTFFSPVSLFASSVEDADWLLLAGDETALPAIGALLETLPEGARALVYVEVADAAEKQSFATRAQVHMHWLYRGATAPGRGDLLLDAVRTTRFPAGAAAVWLAAEAGVVRALRRHLVDERGVDRQAIDFTGHWRLALTQDDAPTQEDIAEAQGRLAGEAAEEPEHPASEFDRAYVAGTAPWVIGGPQPVVVALEEAGLIGGAVLDAGCGTGEHTIHLARIGYDVRGIDSSRPAIEQARTGAAEQGVEARFAVADALELGDAPCYDTVVDSALFHVFSAGDRARYTRSLRRVCRPGALVHVLALSDVGQGPWPTVGEAAIREAFGQGWVIEDLSPSLYRGVVGSGGELGDLPAWLARVRRA
ncbi:SIP domain-containing protein [Nocardiopsis ansamitocini]|uniref:FAD-binding FR-type domain-containing protein n=1 Tax=Nocardiopsis ansamitocini TaxID=1670832 RepID=A0A9W6P7G4_9ACTN|nr:SIP domain-containing protein [Nocardiopsis ansamitocini]GLU48427.1 hypothetical protein Nans01_27780 [Nocardiopsis ansamitocini]